MKALLFINLFLSTLSIIPNWNLKNSSKDLLTSNTYTYTITHREMYNLVGKLDKTIERSTSDNSITHKNTLYINNKEDTTNTNTKTIDNVPFENIESLYKMDDGNNNFRRILCPIGKHHPINIDSNPFQENDNSDIDDNNEWDLKCYNHNEGHFFIYYFMNGEKQVYDLLKTWGYTKLDNLKMFDELYDFKLVNKDTNKNSGPYPICALIKMDNNINFFASEYNFGNDKSITRSPDKNKNLTSAKTYTQGYFNNYTNHFYFITYNDNSDFVSGYSNVTNEGIDLYTTSKIQIKLNENSPFEFSDEVEIREMKFLLYTHYVYYSIYNKKTTKTYHGVLNVKTNKIVFNTIEDINVFIPYSNNSMLAITPESAYRICLIQDSSNADNCLESCPDDSSNLILDIDGNKCSSSTACEDGKYTLLPEGVCICSCNTTIYALQENNCGLCRDLESTKKYKIIDSTVCISQSEIPVEAEEYNPNFNLYKCKSGYQLGEDGKTCIPHCYPTCKTCSEYSQEEDAQKCVSCNSSYYLEGDKCLPKIPTTIPKTIPKVDCLDEKCATCDEESNKLGLCLTCNEGYTKVNYTIIWTNFLDCKKKGDPKLNSYYYNSTLEEYRPCYKTCKRCLKAGNPEAHNCLECENNFMFRPGDNPYNNCVAYSEFYFMNSYGQYKSLEVYQCPEESKYYIKEKKSCIDDCKKDKDYKYLYNGNCYKDCPSDTNRDDVNYLCTANPNKCVLGTNDIYLKENDNLTVLSALVKSYISEFYYTEHYVSLYKNKIYSILIYKDSNCIKELAVEMPNVDFQSCYTKVQQAYGITEKLIIVIVDKKTASNPKTFYSFYHPTSGLKLNADEICKEESIIVKENLDSLLNKEDTHYEVQTSLISQGINIFDLNDPFFTDICYDFENPLEKDIPLNDRIKDIYPDAELCDEGCQYKGINLADMTATCDCKFNDIANSNLVKDNEILDSAFGEVLDLINSSNILVFKCFKYMFKHFARSIGGWISLILIISHISMTLLFIFIGIPKIKMYIYSLTQNYINFIGNKIQPNPQLPPKRNFKSHKNLNNITKKIPPKPVKRNSETNFKNNIKNNFARKPQLRNNEIAKSSKDDILISLEQQNKTKESEDLNVNTEMELNEGDIKLDINPEKYDKNFFEEYMKTSLDDLEFDDAVVLDKRKYCEHMRENLLEDQIIASTFIVEDPIKPRSIKIILFGLNVILYFVVNGLFFSEEVISELYNVNEDEENFFSYFPRSIERLIYTTIVSIVVAMIADFFFISESKIKGIFRRDKDDIKNLKKNIIELVADLKKRYFAFIIIVSIILLISFFYLLCFNYVYPYTQIEWIKSSITIMIIMQILSTLKCILETSLRYLSYKFNSEKLYKISKILD